MSGNRTLRWCAEHDEPAWVYDDGSSWCWYDSIVEASNPHQIVNLPQDDEIERLTAERDALRLIANDMTVEMHGLRAAGDALAVRHRKTFFLDGAFDAELRQWEAARRG